jgi:CDP-paratose synthetase
MNILITGATGYLGSQLAFAFSNHTVILLTRENNNKEFLSTISPDVIINTICSYGRNGESISQIYNSNFYTGVKLLEFAKSLDNPVLFINCGSSLEKNTNLYSISKSQLVEFGEFISNDKLQFINMNLQHFYGLNVTNNFISFVISNCLANNTLPLTAGTQQRDFIYISDVVNAFKVVVQKKNLLSNFENIDIGTGIAMPIKDVVLKIKELTKSNSKLLFGKIPLRDNEVDEMKANISKLQSLGWAPQYSIDDGLKEIL